MQLAGPPYCNLAKQAKTRWLAAMVNRVRSAPAYSVVFEHRINESFNDRKILFYS